MPKTTELTIIVLNYNGQFWLKKTLLTLKEFYLSQTKYPIKVIVVDNNSSDDSVEVVKKQFKWVELIQLNENVGFAAGNNVALKKVTTKYAMLLNSDMEFTEHSNLDVILEFMDQHSEIGVSTPKVSLVNGKLDAACHRGEPTLWASFTYFTKLAQLFPNSRLFGQYHLSYLNLNSIHAIDACSGAAMIVRTAALKKVGLLDEQFFMYAEDLDWCKRFREEGYVIMYHPATTVIHHKYKSGINSSATQLKRKTTVHFYDTMLQYYDKHYQDRYPQWVRTIIKYFLDLKKGGL